MGIACQFKDKTPFTVGTPRKMTCYGRFSSLKSSLQIKGLSQYALHILDVKNLNHHQMDLVVTSYQTGFHKNQSFKITDGITSIDVDPISWQVSSVITQGEVIPHPPYGPWSPSLPTWYVASWGILSFLILGFIFMRIFSYRTKRLIMSQVKERLKDLTPVQYFIKQMSYFITHKPEVEKLDQFLREFLENHFYISTKDSIKKVLSHKKIKSDPEIVQILSEFKNSQNYSEEDISQLLDMARSWVFKTEKL